MDLVECDETYKPALFYAFGSTILCDTLEGTELNQELTSLLTSVLSLQRCSRFAV